MHDDLLVGIATGDDAGVFALGNGRALVQTVDIFAPVVDSAEDWGRIAAANALSDIYAMGGEPLTALQYLAWPRDDLPFDLASEVIAGGMDVMAEGGCTVVGGHSIDGPEPHYGFAVTGLVAEDRVVTNAGAQPEDVLALTKPLGIGIITTAIKRGQCPPDLAKMAIEVMSSLNDVAGGALSQSGAHAATDVTGFGLLGHLREICQASRVGAEIDFDKVPILPGVSELLEAGMWAGGSRRNFLSLEPEISTDRPHHDIRLLVDAQTSGGLLVSLSEDDFESYRSVVKDAAIVGRVTAEKTLRVV